MYVLDAGRPAVETKDFIREGDTFLGGDVVDLLARGAAASRQILRSQLLLQPDLEGGDLGSSEFGYVRLGFFERVGDAAVLVARTVDSHG